MNNIEVKDIFASLKYGRLIVGSRLNILILAICTTILIPLITIGIVITIILGAMECDSTMIWCIVIFNLYALLALILYIYTLVKHKKHISYVCECLKDSIKLTANARRLDIENPYLYKRNQIEVVFQINGEIYRKKSYPGNYFSGYRKYFLDFCNKQFQILYSKKYDEILLLNK